MTHDELLTELRVLAISKREWETRAESAHFQFETIGLDAELHHAIIREGQELNELYRAYAKRIPGCLGEPASSLEAA
jgi:hypothetical protein